jgi:O-antigen/teichoic acid export membrane protein
LNQLASARARLGGLIGSVRGRGTGRATLGTAALNGATTGVNFVITVVLAHALGSHGYGIFAFATAVAALLVSPATLGLPSLVVRNVAGYRVTQAWALLRGLLLRALQAVVAASLVLILLAALIGVVIADQQPGEAHAYLIALLIVPIIALASIRQSVLQGFDQVVLGRVPEGLVQPVAFLIFVVVGTRVVDLTGAGAVLLYVASAVVASVFGLVLLVRALPEEVRHTPPAYDGRAWARSAFHLFLLSGIPAVANQVDVILLGAIKDTHAAGIFDVADRASLFVGFFLVAATYPLGPRIARLWVSGAHNELQRVITRSTKVVFSISVAVAVVLLAFAPQILTVFGREFVEGDTALRILVVGQLVNTGTGVVGLVLMMTGHERDTTRAAGLGALIGAFLNVVLIGPFGLVGAAIATSIGVVATNVLLLRRLWGRTGLWAAITPMPRALREPPSKGE